MGQLAPFDLVLLLILSNAVQNSMNGGDNSLVGGLLSAATLLLLDYFFSWWTFKSKTAENIFEGKPEVLIHNGKLDQDLIRRERITSHELEAVLRREECRSIEDVQLAVIENNGAITVIKNSSKHNSSEASS